MKILHVIETLARGGAERLLVMLLPELARKGHDVAVAVREAPYDLQPELEAAISAVEQESPQLIEALLESQRQANELMLAEMQKDSAFGWMWRPAGMWMMLAVFGWLAMGRPIVNAFLFIGLDLTTRDALHEAWAGRWLWPRMLTLIVSGGLIAYALGGDPRISLASCLAFTGAGVADALAYAALGGRARLARVNGSNVAGAAVDSLLFPLLAFGLPLLWPIVLGQFTAKVAGGLVWSLALGRKP